LTPFFYPRGHAFQKLLEKIFISVDHLQTAALRVFLQRVQSFLIFLVGVDVRIEKISDGLVPFFLHSFKGINGAVGTTDVEKDFHSIKS
jgi:hypothetical protein